MINVGVLGFAHGHIGGFGTKWQDNPSMGIKITKGWDWDSERAKTSCTNLKCLQVETLDDILNDESIGAVVICAETSMHAELCIKAAEAKKNIICYKPMALTLAQADEMVEAVEKNGVRFTVAYQMRVDPQNIKIKELILNDTVGKPCLFRRRHGLPTHVWGGFEHSWHTQPQYNRDIFADDSSHPIDMMNWIFGKAESVMCEMSTMVNPAIPNDNGVALFKYPNGMIAEISCSFTCSASEITTEVYGSKGCIQQYYGDNPSMRLPHPENALGLSWFCEGDSCWTNSDIPSPNNHGVRISDQAEPLAAFLKNERGPICSVYEGRDSLRMVLACYLSASTGERVKIDDNRIYSI